MITGVVLGNLAYLFGTPLAGIYAPGEPDVVRQAVTRLLYVSCPYFLCGIMDTLVGVLRGLGSSVIPMIVSLVGACGLRLVWVAIVFPIEHSPESLYISYPISWAVTAAVHTVFLIFVRKRAFRKVHYHAAGSGAGSGIAAQ